MMQQQQKLMRPLNHIELQCAYQDAWRVCHPNFKQPFSSLEDACERFVVSIQLSNFISIFDRIHIVEEIMKSKQLV